jgi:hypothetical protein
VVAADQPSVCSRPGASRRGAVFQISTIVASKTGTTRMLPSGPVLPPDSSADQVARLASRWPCETSPESATP